MSTMQLSLPHLVFLVLFPSVCLANDILLGGEAISTSRSLDYNAYELVMQSDCNLVLYDNNRAVWSSGTNGRGSGCRADMQRDGNFVIYNQAYRAVWATNTNYGFNSDYYLALQPDRNVVLYQDGRAVWATNTNIFGAGVTIAPQKNVTSSSP